MYCLSHLAVVENSSGENLNLGKSTKNLSVCTAPTSCHISFQHSPFAGLKVGCNKQVVGFFM